jgi:hypothetical protein
MSNLTIVNIMMFFAILCLTLSASEGLPLYFIYSIAAVAMAGTLQHQLSDHKEKATKRR